MDANLDFIDRLEEHEGFKYVSAVNPFDVYNFLLSEKEGGVRMKISPIQILEEEPKKPLKI